MCEHDAMDPLPPLGWLHRQRLAEADRAAGLWSSGGAPLADGSPEPAGLLVGLRAAVTRSVHERRAAGVPVERVLVEVKGLVGEAQRREGWRDVAGAVQSEVVGWSIAAFYDGTGEGASQAC